MVVGGRLVGGRWLAVDGRWLVCGSQGLMWIAVRIAVVRATVLFRNHAFPHLTFRPSRPFHPAPPRPLPPARTRAPSPLRMLMLPPRPVLSRGARYRHHYACYDGSGPWVDPRHTPPRRTPDLPCAPSYHTCAPAYRASTAHDIAHTEYTPAERCWWRWWWW